MKYVFVIFCWGALSATAQVNDEPVKLTHYLLDSFVNGKVLLRSGAASNQLLNYNLVTHEMIFDHQGTYLAIANPENTDTVFLMDRKFVPVKNAFYEVITGGNYPLFIEHTCTIKEEGASTGFGNTNAGAAHSIKSLENSGAAYKLKLPDGYEIIPARTYYILKNGKYNKVNNEQQLIKLFPGKKEMIKKFIKSNHTDFSRREDVAALVQQIQ